MVIDVNGKWLRRIPAASFTGITASHLLAPLRRGYELVLRGCSRIYSLGCTRFSHCGWLRSR
jgi:hypothetical protein